MNNIGDISENCLTINQIDNTILNFKQLLKSNNSIIFKNCKNLDINFDNTINKLIFNNCEHIKLQITKTIFGIEINKSNNIEIKVKFSDPIYNLTLENSKNISLLIRNKNNMLLNVDKKSTLKIHSDP